ncbi:hypothetical protein ACFO7V_05725 [Glutamicibacter bergerei]|uniref:Uncharacterized protein n=1 Tax=Glutamicibacter bergerei TaxID=256702 RepID=A0ABV9MII1_9MICC
MQQQGRSGVPSVVVSAYEATFRFHASDLLRFIAVFSVPVAWMNAGPAAAAAMALVSGGTWLLRYYARSRVQDVYGQLAFISAGIFSSIGLYQAIWWLDLAVHLIVMAVITALVNEILIRRKDLTQVASQVQQRHVACELLTYGSLAAVLWEFGEWGGYFLVSPEIGVGILDSVTDFFAGILGILGTVFWISSNRKSQ